MKIAVTADVHLTAWKDHPERYSALKNILKQMKEMRIENLIIAGDLFDKGFQNYSEFEALCKEYSCAQFHIIPGNHDPDICEGDIPGENIHIYTEPRIEEFDSLPFLFLPYEENLSMGEKIAPMEDNISQKPWILVAHGDYFAGVKERNIMEPGTYMPLVKKDLDRFKPKTVLLGHIHKAVDMDNIHYPGSPCGLDINETGKRSFLLYDTLDRTLESRMVETDILYFSETFVIVPVANEIKELEQEIDHRINSWNIDSSYFDKVRVRVSTTGYSSNKEAILNTLLQKLGNFRFYKNEDPDISGLSTSKNPQLSSIAIETKNFIAKMDWNFGGDEPDRKEVVNAALTVIYEKNGIR